MMLVKTAPCGWRCTSRCRRPCPSTQMSPVAQPVLHAACTLTGPYWFMAWQASTALSLPVGGDSAAIA